jgi:hypothetical protein
MADAGDSKSPAPCGRVGSTPISGTKFPSSHRLPEPPQSGQSRPPCPAPVAAQLRQGPSGRRRPSSRATAPLARSLSGAPLSRAASASLSILLFYYS